MLAGLGGGEGEAAGAAVALGHDPVVIVEDLVDGDEDLQVGVDGIRVRLLVDDFGGEASCRGLVLMEGPGLEAENGWFIGVDIGS